ncbi:snoRNA-binding domain protein, putative [Medicago truncatula]|uniref:SnoRNA-binding domain protein, putative n=1 Tax=Medicago truncatula TaxID=3880 RepID=G7KPT4_MEDTR|nr:snoRNA-binding domain protein, putative [Medicago truncatula]
MTSNFTKEISKGYKNKSSNLILLKSQSLSVTKRLNLNGVYQAVLPFALSCKMSRGGSHQRICWLFEMAMVHPVSQTIVTEFANLAREPWKPELVSQHYNYMLHVTCNLSTTLLPSFKFIDVDVVRGRTSKYGLIYNSSFIGKASSRNKGRIARNLANKCSIASRIDCFSESGNTIAFGEKLREFSQMRLMQL